jgi:hypothetical protein
VQLRNYLKQTKLTKLDREIVKKSTVWDFVEGSNNGGAYELEYNDEEGVPIKPRRHNFVPQVEG